MSKHKTNKSHVQRDLYTSKHKMQVIPDKKKESKIRGLDIEFRVLDESGDWMEQEPFSGLSYEDN